MTETKLILLWGMPDELMLIVAHPSGVRYQNQVAGVSNIQRHLEGVLAPIEVSPVVRGRIQSLEFPLRPGIPEATADALDSLLAGEPAARFIKVDRERLLDSHEAWVFVRIDSPEASSFEVPPRETETYFGPLFGFGSCRGVLTWINSD